MKTAIPGILDCLGESEYSLLTSAYCRLRDLRDHLARMHDGFVTEGTPPPLEGVEAARLLDEAFGDIEQYVLAISEPGEAACPVYRKAA